jgi:hypothetical protein
VRESVHRLDVSDLALRHRDGHAVSELVLRRCIYEVRVLDVHLRSDYVQREFRLAFRHPCVVVCPKDSKHRYCAWRHELRRAVIRRDYGHLDRVVRVVRGIRLLPP